ncbi:MAG: hypothetical protein JXA30_03655 [Deltaproteobacteria bacterium]|nr:hypothetical protein [Deltaproteobacteria bacterium]
MAEKAAVLPPYADRAIEPEQVELITWLVADWLRERGVEPIMPKNAESELSLEPRQCRKTDCVPSYLKRIQEAEYAVVTTLASGTAGNGVALVTIAFVDGDGKSYEQEWPAGEQIELAVDAALTHGFTAFLKAQSEIVAVRAETNESKPAPIVESRPAADPTSAEIEPLDEHSEDQASVWNYVLGASLLAGSVPLILFPAITAIKDGECWERDPWDRCNRFFFGTRSIVLLALGGASLVAGSVFVLFTPITVQGELSIEDGQGVIRLGGRF